MYLLFALILNVHAAKPAPAKPVPRAVECKYIRSQLVDVAFDDVDSYDTYNLADQGVFAYMCNGPTDETEKLCARATKLKCAGY